MNPGWMLPKAAVQWIEKNIDAGENILEFGSGDGSQQLAENYELFSIEHDVNWLGKTQSTYIHAPIVSNRTSTRYGQKGWYDPHALDNLPETVALIIVDGPPGEIGRLGLLEHLGHLPDWTFVLVDDTDRGEEQQLVQELCLRLGCQAIRIETEQFKANGDVRKFDILERR
tara:strand:- start:5351 stop:5863 length:513 start_codon:yes stop_codon:yes gene_type:complete